MFQDKWPEPACSVSFSVQHHHLLERVVKYTTFPPLLVFIFIFLTPLLFCFGFVLFCFCTQGLAQGRQVIFHLIYTPFFLLSFFILRQSVLHFIWFWIDGIINRNHHVWLSFLFLLLFLRWDLDVSPSLAWNSWTSESSCHLWVSGATGAGHSTHCF